MPVKGFVRSTICDIQRDAYIIIPTALYEILTVDIKSMTVESVVETLGDDNLLAWLDMLVENEFGFYTHDKHELDSLAKLDLRYHEPLPVTNAIVDIDFFSNHNLIQIFFQLSSLLCEAIEIRIFYQADIKLIHDILKYTSKSSFRSVQLLVEYHAGFSTELVHQLFHNYPRLQKLTFHGCHENQIMEMPGNRMLIYTDAIINSENHCGVISPALLSSNIFLFIEGMHRNNCLNRKVSIDKHGNIKNCPSHPVSYGNIAETKLHDVVYKESFQSVWSVTKDMIEVCKDCEFRLMCQDCRAYLSNPDDPFSKPLKCNYDPYKATWKQEILNENQ